MKRLNPAHVEAVMTRVNACPYFTLLSMEIRSIGWGQSRLEAAVQGKHLQPYGVVHGGVCASLVDAAAFWAVYAQVDETAGLTTVEMKLNYLAPASWGRLLGKGKSLRVGKTLCLGEASVEDETGRLLAYGTATMMIVDEFLIEGQSELPPKFLE